MRRREQTKKKKTKRNVNQDRTKTETTGNDSGHARNVVCWFLSPQGDDDDDDDDDDIVVGQMEFCLEEGGFCGFVF